MAMEARFSAEFLDGQSAAIQPVWLAIDLGRLRIDRTDGGAGLGAWPLTGLTVEDLHNGVWHLRHPSAPGALLTSRDAGLSAALEQQGLRAASLPRGRKLVRLAAIYAGALALAVAAAYAGIPALSRALARRVPIELEQRLVGVDVLLKDQLCHSDQAEAALAQLTTSLAGGVPPGMAARQVQVLNWDLVNAFTFPGGQVVLTRGLVDKAESPDEIAGVLAHEFEHVRQRHIMAQFIRASIFSLGWAITVGDFSGLFVLDPSTMFAIASQSFSRTDERSADQGALARLDAAGISRQGFGAFFKRVQKDLDLMPAWLTSHPATQERLLAIETGAPTAATRPALTAAQWQALQQACGNRPVSNPLRELFED